MTNEKGTDMDMRRELRELPRPDTSGPAPWEPKSPAIMIDLLGRPFRPEVVQQRKIGGGRSVAYVSVDAVIERLNKATNGWDFRIVSRDREVMQLNRWNEQTRRSEPRDVPVSIVVGEIEIPELGRRQALGVQALDDGAGEDLLKGAASDSLKKCASLFGVPISGS